MATTYTPNYNLAQPEVGGEIDTWGGLLNTDLLTIDTTMKAISDVANGALPKAGGTMTGDLLLSKTGATTRIELLNSAAGQDHFVLSRVGGNLRWAANFGDNSAESGSNAGSNFVISRYSDAGALLSNPLAINRATGLTTVGNGLAVLSGAAITGASSVVGAFSVTGLVTAAANGGGQLRLEDSSGSGHYLRLGTGLGTAGDGIGWIMPDTGTLRVVNPSGQNAIFTAAVVNTFTGATSTQTQFRNIGWSNEVARWKEYMEADASYSLYYYDSAGALVRRGMNISNTGVVSAVDFAATSDRRLKSDLAPITDAMDRLRQIVPQLYTKDGRREAGVIAQEVQTVLAPAVHAQDDGFLAVSHGQLQALVIAALHELDARVAALELL